MPLCLDYMESQTLSLGNKMTSDGQVSTLQEMLAQLSPGEQESLGALGPVSGLSVLALLKRVRELFGQQKLEDLLTRCNPDLSCSWSITTAMGKS